jgi:GMP synthase (glutamine-hydrolysing)
MKIHCLQHADFETPGCIVEWINKNQFELSTIRPYKGESFPEINTVDFLIIMGGPQSPSRLDKYSYLKSEIEFIQKIISQEKIVPVVGICLGAQLIAEALGGQTEKSPHREIGVFPIQLLPEAKNDPVFSKFPHTFLSSHWHNDMPGLSPDITWLAKSAGCPRQIFRYKNHVYGLQCHLEMTNDNIKEMLDHCKNDLRPDKYIQSSEEFLKADFNEINQKMFILLECLKFL